MELRDKDEHQQAGCDKLRQVQDKVDEDGMDTKGKEEGNYQGLGRRKVLEVDQGRLVHYE